MTREQFEREKNYRVALSVAKAMLACGLINERDFAKINTKLIVKYRPVFGGLCR